MVLVGWRGVGGGGARGGEARAGRDARARVGGGCRAVRVRGAGNAARPARVAGGRARRLLRGHRRAAHGRRRRARLQQVPGRDLADVPCRRLSTLPAQYHAAATLHRAARR